MGLDVGRVRTAGRVVGNDDMNQLVRPPQIQAMQPAGGSVAERKAVASRGRQGPLAVRGEPGTPPVAVRKGIPIAAAGHNARADPDKGACEEVLIDVPLTEPAGKQLFRPPHD